MSVYFIGFSFKVLFVLIEKRLLTMSKMSQINIYPKTEERKLTTLIVERNHNLVNYGRSLLEFS